MDGFQVELFRRLPLAQSVLRLFCYALDESVLEDVFETHRGRCYQDVLTFPGLVYLIRDALVLHGGSGHQAFSKAAAEGHLPVAEQNVYGKLSRIPLDLSMAVLSVGAERLRPVVPEDRPAAVLPKSLEGLHAIVFDGKKIKKAAKRLKPLRGLPGTLLGGKLLVALDLVSGLATEMHVDPDGERNDVPLVPGLVRQVRERISDPILWIGDRQFGNLSVPALLRERSGDHFLVRCPTSLTLRIDTERPSRSGIDSSGRSYVEEWGWIGCEVKRRLYVRRITLDRVPEETILLITDLLDDDRWPATDLLDTYLQRWGIERMFQKVTEVFNLQTLIGSSPAAMIFQAAMCFLLYDMIQVVQVFVAEDGGRTREEVSTEKLFRDVAGQLSTWKDLGDPEVAAEHLASTVDPTSHAGRIGELSFSEKASPPERGEGVDQTRPCDEIRPSDSPVAMTAWLRETLKGRWSVLWVKSPPKRKRSSATEASQAKVPRGHGGHTSTWRVLQAAKTKKKKGPRS